MKQASCNLQDGAIISLPCLDSHIHFYTGKLGVNLAGLLRSFSCLKRGKGLLSVLFPTVFLCHFRTRAELDKYLEASQIRERAIERINDVTGTYGLFSSFCLHFLSLVICMIVLF